MNYLYKLVFALLLTIQVNAQTYYSRGYRSQTFNDPARSGRPIATDIYYPTSTAGNNVPVAIGTARFPVVVFGHGFSLSAGSYSRLADTLTRYGYIVAMPTTETGLAPSHDNFGKDLSFLCSKIIQLDSDPTSFLFQRVTAKAAVGGHSMGGGCSMLAAGSGNNDIDALFNMAAAETNPSATSAALNVTVPSLLFSGSSDCIVPPATQLNMYNNISNACKSNVNITGATHCQIADNNFTCVFGQITSGCNSSPITLNNLFDKTSELLIPFLDYTLNGNCNSGIVYVNRLNSSSGITVNSNCPVPNCNILPNRILQFKGRHEPSIVKLMSEIVVESSTNTSIVYEKSSNGIQFSDWKTFPVVSSSLVFTNQVEDLAPYSPVSYYRLKLTAGSHTVKSGTLAIKTGKGLNLSMPAGNVQHAQLLLLIDNPQKSPYSIRICDMTGKLMHQLQPEMNSTSNTIVLPIQTYARGTYFVELRAAEQPISVNRFIKI